MFLQLESKLNLHFKVNVPFLLVLIYLLCLNPEASRTLSLFLYKISVRRFDFIFFWGKQFGFRTVAGFWFNRCICQYPRNSFFLTFLTSFYFFFFVYRLLKPPYRLKGLLDRIVRSPTGPSYYPSLKLSAAAALPLNSGGGPSAVVKPVGPPPAASQLPWFGANSNPGDPWPVPCGAA